MTTFIISICFCLICLVATVAGVIFTVKTTLSLWSDCMLLRIKIAEQRVRLRQALYPPQTTAPRR